jgi:ammonia channel protein AmtB
MCIYENVEIVTQKLTILDSFFYSGLARRKSALSLIWLSIMATAVISFQWFFWGYSLAFSHTAGKFLGDLENIGFRNLLAAPSVGSPRIPDLLFAVYQGMFAAITVALAVGAVAERGRMVRYPARIPFSPFGRVNDASEVFYLMVWHSLC